MIILHGTMSRNHIHNGLISWLKNKEDISIDYLRTGIVSESQGFAGHATSSLPTYHLLEKVSLSTHPS